MSELEHDLQVAAEMASVSVATSPELVEIANDSSALGRLQTKLSNSQDRVIIAKNILEETEAHQLTPELAKTIDDMISRSVGELGVVSKEMKTIEAVGGVEDLGFSLTPSRFIETRLDGCEGLLDTIGSMFKKTITSIHKTFKDSYTLLTNDADKLHKSLDSVEEALEKAGKFNKDLETINLGGRLFNLLKLDGKVSGKWISDVDKTARTFKGLSDIYYLNAGNQTNALISYFNRFADDDQEQAIERLTLVNQAVASKPFKECKITNKELSSSDVTVKESVEMMGGAKFQNAVVNTKTRKFDSVDQAIDTLEYETKNEYVKFIRKSDIDVHKSSDEFKSLSSDEIKVLIKRLRSVLDDAIKDVEKTQKYMIQDPEFLGTLNSIGTNTSDDKTQKMTMDAFLTICWKNQIELNKVRTDSHAYLVLWVAGLVDLMSMSIRVNKE